MIPARSTLELRSAGMKPKASELAHERTSANTTAVQSSDTFGPTGTGASDANDVGSREKIDP